jgi:hypothetical protein
MATWGKHAIIHRKALRISQMERLPEADEHGSPDYRHIFERRIFRRK